MIRKYFLFVLVIVSLFAGSCGKDKHGGAPPPPPPPPPPDSLGTGWSKVMLPNVFEVFFADNNIGYASGYGLYKSTNGGVTWSSIVLPTNVNSISNMFWLDATHGWLSGLDNGNTPYILRTVDGAASFKKVSLPGGASILDVQFFNRRLGYAVAYNELFISSDSGNTWKATASKFDDEGFTLFFVDSANGYIAGRNRIFRTTDGGASFTLQQSFTQASTPCGIQFIDANTGWVPSNAGLYRTINSGTNWELTGVTGKAFDVHFFNKDQGFLLQEDAIRKTMDGGKSFSPVVKTGSRGLIELHFTDSKHGWAVREGQDGYILRYVEP